jgi:hypothetical protein
MGRASDEANKVAQLLGHYEKHLIVILSPLCEM